MEYLSPRSGLGGYSTKEVRERKDYAPNQILEGYGKYGTHTGSRLIRRTIGKNLSRFLVAERSKSATGCVQLHPVAAYRIATNTFSANIDDPNGVGATTAAAINDHDQIVGFYVNGAGNTIGLLATPVR